ncbi:GNAT family N-acetyltransferase [Nonomuraea gerenzanensis]|uniref:N-acetyltransferase domain-containing protein n=1 Tax=Nonomuraea gerenzanensis TaxID=93944 RepID=A0A1M4E7J9_9ACTN|nr:GNAT family N-acetyltransferase [Nonomuraea gerenzanensis]UBU17095.1 GNAT family N-acetyltransferase [Nonomuraea gerenzanensis]SBO94830.1 hypothetical protein BN4615_P4346 [Nonomuraea gerenzanensis]
MTDLPDVPAGSWGDAPGVRAATLDDMPAVRRVARRFGLLSGWPPGAPDFLDAERTLGTLLVAPAHPADASESARGFGGTLRRGDLTHLGDLFVLPAHQSSGIGRTLLSRLLAGDGPKATFASSDPRAISLYIRHGLRPWCPLLYLTGPATTGLPAPPVRPTPPDAIAPLDSHVSGGDRHDTLTWYATLPGVQAYTTGEGYAFTRTTAGETLIGPAGGTTPQNCATAVLGALAATGTPGTAKLALPGLHPLVPTLIAAGWRIADLDTLMADDAALALIHPDRYAPHPDLG